MTSPFVLQEPKSVALLYNITINGIMWISITLYSKKEVQILAKFAKTHSR